MRKILLLLCLTAMSMTGLAQNMEVKDFNEVLSAEAKTYPRLDRVSKRNCAIIKVYASNIKDYVFEGKIEGEVEYSEGEARIYMRPGASYVTVKNSKYDPIEYEFPDVMVSEKVYAMRLIVANNKVRTLVMPVAGIGKTFSYGIMVGIVKKYGGYLKAKYNFKSVSTSLESNNLGYTKTGDEIWFNGEKSRSRLSVTGGALCRLSQPLYLYGGLGYGEYTYARQTSDDLWAKDTDNSTKGVEAEVGFIARLKNFAVSAGIETCSMKYWELNVGLGIIF